jgi:hypothetical protein
MTITLTREEAQQVLDALNSCGEDWIADGEWETQVDDYDHELVANALETIRNRLAQPEPEPIAYKVGDATVYIKPPIYNAPPQRNWQRLTDEEVMSLLPGAVRLPPGWVDTVRAIEAKLKEKNA